MIKIFEKLLTKQWLVLALVLIVSVFFFWQVKQNSRMETDVDEYMPQDHPAFVYSNQAEERFNIKKAII